MPISLRKTSLAGRGGLELLEQLGRGFGSRYLKARSPRVAAQSCRRGDTRDLAFKYLEPEASAELLKEFETARPANEVFSQRYPAYGRSPAGA